MIGGFHFLRTGLCSILVRSGGSWLVLGKNFDVQCWKQPQVGSWQWQSIAGTSKAFANIESGSGPPWLQGNAPR